MGGRVRFVGQVVAGQRVRDAWRTADEPVPLATEALEGAWVEVEVRQGRARVARVVAGPGTALASLVVIAATQGLDPVFPDAVRAEVDALFEGADPDAPPGTEDPSLVNLLDVPFITIDNEGSRDLDQALHVARVGDGHRVRYALADAAYYVRPGTACFEDALSRGASFYLPGWMVPMLDRRLSEGLISLNEGVLRRALVFDMHLDADGRCSRTEVLRARIRSRKKLTYDGVQEFLDAPDAHEDRDAEYASSLRELAVVGSRRIDDAISRDVVHHRRRTVEAGLTGTQSFVLYSGLRNDVERYNEQISLLCNVEGARLLRGGDSDARVQPIYRVHPAPPEERVTTFVREVDRLAELHGHTDAHGHAEPRWRWDRASGQSLAAFLEGLPVDGEDARVAQAIRRQAILMNVRSTFSELASEHHGVGADAYARFSSPMREVVGVFLHKELWEQLHGGGAGTEEADEALRLRVIDAANRSKNVQGQLTSMGNRLALDQLFEADAALDARERPVRTGTVMGIAGSKVYLGLDDPAIDVKLYRADLEVALGPLRLVDGELAIATADGARVATIGDRLEVRVSHRDPRRDRWVLLPVGASAR